MYFKSSILLLAAAFTVGNALNYDHPTYSGRGLSIRDLIFEELDTRGFDVDDVWGDDLFGRALYERDLFDDDELDFWIRADDVPTFNFQSATPIEKPKTPPQLFTGPRMGTEQYFAGSKKPAYIPTDNPVKKPKGYPESAPAMRPKLNGIDKLPKLNTKF